MKRVAIVQSNYVPWKGYFDLIGSVDEFILLDDAQYTRRDWRNRNRIKTPQGTKWLTIPVQVRGRYHQRIDETLISDPAWAENHWKTLYHSYRQAPCFDEVAGRVEALYASSQGGRLSDVNRHFIEGICDLLGIDTALSWSTDYGVVGTRSERLVDLCEKAGADEYLSGPTAREYLDEPLFAQSGISVSYIDYTGYPEYDQPHGDFDHHVSVLDLIFCTGEQAPDHLSETARSGARD